MASDKAGTVASERRPHEPTGGEGPSRGINPGGGSPTGWRALLRLLSFRNISALYIFVLLFIIFSLWVPSTFLSSSNWTSLLDNQAITGLTAVALVIPVSAGAFDLAIGTEVGVGSIFIAWLIINMHIASPLAIVVTILGGALVGLLSGLLITRVRMSSFIATLGVSSILTALIQWISGGEQILNLPQGFQNVAIKTLFGLTYPFWIMLLVAAGVWYVLERTPVGRRIYATGGNPESARLAGVATSKVIIGSLMACGALAVVAGVLLTSSLGVGDPTVGPPYLLPAFSAVFLGSTQFRDGRFNVWGTIVAVYVLATGVKGLQLAGGPVWTPDLFNGVALLLAVGLANVERSGSRFSAIRRLAPVRRPKAEPPGPDRASR